MLSSLLQSYAFNIWFGAPAWYGARATIPSAKPFDNLKPAHNVTLNHLY